MNRISIKKDKHKSIRTMTHLKLILIRRGGSISRILALISVKEIRYRSLKESFKGLKESFRSLKMSKSCSSQPIWKALKKIW